MYAETLSKNSSTIDRVPGTLPSFTFRKGNSNPDSEMPHDRTLNRVSYRGTLSLTEMGKTEGNRVKSISPMYKNHLVMSVDVSEGLHT